MLRRLFTASDGVAMTPFMRNDRRRKRLDPVVMVHGIDGVHFIPEDDAERALWDLLRARLMRQECLTETEAEERPKSEKAVDERMLRHVDLGRREAHECRDAQGPRRTF